MQQMPTTDQQQAMFEDMKNAPKREKEEGYNSGAGLMPLCTRTNPSQL